MIRNLTGRICLFIMAAASVAFAVPAAAFTFRDDPSSAWRGDKSKEGIIDGNTIIYHDVFQARNLTNAPLPELNFAIPFVWPVLNKGTPSEIQVPMQWRNDRNGWFTDNFNNTGTSLTVTLTNADRPSVAMHDLADVTGSNQLPLTEPCMNGSPSCVPPTPETPPETRNLDDRIPVISLGTFAPNETKSFDVAFNYSFGDQRVGALRTAFSGNTISAIAPIPEPETYAMLLAGLALLGLTARRQSDRF